MAVDNNNNNSSKPLTFVPERMEVEEFHQRCDEMGLAYKRLENYIADATQQSLDKPGNATNEKNLNSIFNELCQQSGVNPKVVWSTLPNKKFEVTICYGMTSASSIGNTKKDSKSGAIENLLKIIPDKILEKYLLSDDFHYVKGKM